MDLVKKVGLTTAAVIGGLSLSLLAGEGHAKISNKSDFMRGAFYKNPENIFKNKDNLLQRYFYILSWEDTNRNNELDNSDKITSVNKKVFRDDEKICVIYEEEIGKKGTTFLIEAINPNGEVFMKQRAIYPYDKTKVNLVMDFYGYYLKPGDYKVSYYFDGFLKDSIEFEIIPSEKK